MDWFVLIVSGMLEAVWAAALAASQNFRKLKPSLLFVVAVIASMVGLAYAMRTLPVGTSYAVWVGIGAVLTVAWAMVRRQEKATVARVGLLLLLVVSVVGLKVAS